ncbi:V-type ATP synthase subunit D [Omnitrophica bacterium]|nr:V-type ATP synthase subunit D [Candidatus Omnitrophota bacterium]
MAKLKLTKNELKRQKEDLKRFMRYLPTLILKKKQLQLEILKILHAIEDLEAQMAQLRESVYEWVDLFAEGINIKDFVEVEKVHTATGNIAGVDIPVFEKVDFIERDYDLLTTPLWVDYGIEAVKKLSTLRARYEVLRKQLEIVREELRITTQRVSLFEKIKIPQARENIRRIRIFLGDLQTAAVVTGKIAKKKIEEKMAEEVLS